ncbi:MAG: DUF1211 domain-containing protein [Pseudomonadales bacterium]|nr:DUF1211 domain-containing protein [Pseudomonadales bacterium]
MAPLEPTFIKQCPSDNGFRLRGMNMTRIEVFVDAAFAFAVTMLVISFDSIPQNFSEMIIAIKNIPAFIFSVVQLIWIWHAHNVWSKRFGLDNGMTVFLSATLLIIVLVYIYPMRIMNQSMMAYFTNGYLYSSFNFDLASELSAMFIFLGIGFFSFCILFVSLNYYALSLKDELLLDEHEIYETRTLVFVWMGAAANALLCILLALILPPNLLPFSGFSLFLLSFWIPYIRISRARKSPLPS